MPILGISAAPGLWAGLGVLSSERVSGAMEDPPSLTGSPMSLLMPSLHFFLKIIIIRINGGVLILSLQLLVKSQFSEIAETK